MARLAAAALALGLLTRVGVAAPAAARPGAGLFVAGTQWTYQVVQIDDVPVERHGRTGWTSQRQPTLRVRCEVAEAVQLGSARASWITCDEAFEASGGMPTPAGVWVANDQGIYHVAPARDAVPGLGVVLATTGRPILAASPRAGTTKHTTVHDGVVIEQVTRRGRDGWCVERDARTPRYGEGTLAQTCFRAGGGLTAGRYAYLSGFPYRVRFTVVRD
ncbi:MAG: hypothetical protein R3B06_15475 [Kofleriaceae bacterium]